MCAATTLAHRTVSVHDDVRARDLLVIERRGGARHRAQHGHRLRPFARIDGDDRLSEPGHRLRRKLKHDVIIISPPQLKMYITAFTDLTFLESLVTKTKSTCLDKSHKTEQCQL